MSSTAFKWKPTFEPLAFARQLSTRTAQTPLSVGEIQCGICGAAARPLNRATTLPAQAYTSEDFFAWELDNLLRPGWQCVAHISQVPNVGDFLNLDLLGEPLIVVRAKDESVRVLSRVCPHRSMDIMPEGFGYDGHGPAEPRDGKFDCGHTRLFLCPYHAWTFELDGQLKACPEMHKAEDFSRDKFFLKPFRSEVWQGFIFVNLDDTAPPLANGLEEMTADLAAFRLDKLKLVIAREWDCPFNWKVLVENFMESYHHLGIHHKSLQPMMPARDTWTEQERRHYVRAHLPYKDSVREAYREFATRGDFSNALPPLPGLNDAQSSEWGLFLIHPTFLLATAPDRVIWYRLQPLGPDRVKLLTTNLVAPEALALPNFEKLREQTAQQLTDFHLEDMEVCTAVQRGFYASAWRPGRLSHLEMPVWLFHRYVAARIRNLWPTDDGQVAPSQRPHLRQSTTGGDDMMCEAPSMPRGSRHEALEFRDGDNFPVMVKLPAGEFIMGENAGDKFANDTERPAHAVRFLSPFVLGKFPVTVGEFSKFQPMHSTNEGDELPVVRVSWEDAAAYCKWLTDQTSRQYRLPSEAEWEFSCRAGSRRPFACGDEISTADANFLYDENGARFGLGCRTRVGEFPVNGFGLHDMHGNVCEWVADSWFPDYLGAPSDGGAWLTTADERRVIRGGAWDYLPRLLRSSWRDWRTANYRADNIGFRVATSDLEHLRTP